MRVQDAQWGWHVLAAVEQAIGEIAVSRNWLPDFYGFVLHEYGDDAEYLPSNDACVAHMQAHVADHSMRTYDANGHWTFAQLGVPDLETSIDAALRIGPNRQQPFMEVELRVSGPAEETVLGIFDALRGVVEAA